MPSDQSMPALPTPPPPGFWRLGWLLFMQPIELHRLFVAWGFDHPTGLWSLTSRLRQPLVRALLLRFAAWLLVAMPLGNALLLGVEITLGVPVSVRMAAFGVILGVVVGIVGGLTISVPGGVAVGMAGGVVWSLIGGLEFGVPGDRELDVVIFVVGGAVAGFVAGATFGTTDDSGPRHDFSVASLVTLGVLLNMAFGLLSAVVLGITAGSATFGLGFGLVVSAAVLRLPIFFVEGLLTWTLSVQIATGWLTASSATKRLPFLHHDFIYFPLPGLQSLLVNVGKREPDLARALIAKATESVGQKRPARLALERLQAESLACACQGHWFMRAADLDLPFLPSEPPASSPLRVFQAAARDLRGYDVKGSYGRRMEQLTHAKRVLENFRTIIQSKRRPERLERLLLPVAQLWLELVKELRALLEQEMREHPQVPTPFVTGTVLTVDKPSLFKGRKDLVGFIDHDLAGDRRGPLWLCGQRRMGKSSLLEMLPVQLGSGTTVVKVNFQGLSGSPLRSEPHRLIATELANSLDASPAPPGSGPWGPALDWFRQVDERLVQAGARVLVAVDEVEGLQKGIVEGWSSPDFLDFVRAAGDTLRRIRLLLVSAYPIGRLGPHWPDRLISALSREITYLKPDEARELVCRPTPDFPDIYPEGGVEHLVTQTRGHPYLLQLVCDELCRRLNEQRRLHATPEDIQAAVDAAFGKTSLFDELWRQQNPAEQSWMCALAAEPRPVERPDEPLRVLTHTHFVEKAGGKYQVAVPMFASWIRDRKGA
jgi:hypothetical protein